MMSNVSRHIGYVNFGAVSHRQQQQKQHHHSDALEVASPFVWVRC
jgi:hypothetical protein